LTDGALSVILYPMKDNKRNLPVTGRILNLNNEANKLFRDKVMMPMVKFAVTLMFIAIVLDYGFQLIEAIDILAAN
jgi:hypothetical protein